jgi:uncharacterized membrane protein YgcG
MIPRQNFRAGLCALSLLAATLAQAQYSSAPPPSAPPKYSAAELEKLAAPIALHPDPLIAIILPASVYPLDIVQAARFVKDTNNLPKVDEQPWDENVKALAKFPELLQKLNDDLTWTMDLGQAFLDQQKELMDTIQVLRGKANSAGVLKTTPQQVIVVTNTIIERTVEQQIVYVTNTVVQIQPSNPQIIYVPAYPPTIYYPPAVYVGPPPVVTFAAGIAVGLIIANNCDWHSGGIYVGHHGVAVWGGGSYHGHGDVNINLNRNININNNNTTINNVNRTPQKWQPDQSRLRTSGAPGAKASAQTAQARGWSSGAATTPPAPSTGAARPGPAPSASRPSPSPSQSYNRAPASPSSARPAPSPSYNRPTSGSSSQPSPGASRGSAFGGISSGTGTRDSSHRGSASRGGGSGGRSLGGRGR